MKANYGILIKIAHNYQLYESVLDLIIHDYIESLSLKIPSKLYNSKIHSKAPSHRIKTDTLTETSIKDKYKEYTDEILSRITSLLTYKPEFKMNVKLLAQLEFIEDIYILINANREKEALHVKFVL